MMMLRLALIAAVLATGCGDGDGGGSGGRGGDGGNGGDPVDCEATSEPGVACTEFCQRIVGDCQAFLFTEASCRAGCQDNVECDGYANSDSCGEAWEAGFQCVAELDCYGVYDWRDKNPQNGYPCQPEVENVGANCPF